MKRVNAFRFECGACGAVQLVENKDEVIGLGGKVWEISQTAGCAAEWFACKRACVTVAIGKALEKAWEA